MQSFTSIDQVHSLRRHALFSFNNNVVILAHPEYSYFSADFGLKIFLYYSYKL